MAATDDDERVGTAEAGGTRLCRDVTTTGVNEVGVFLTCFGSRTHTHHTVLSLKCKVYIFGQVVRNHSRQTDTQVDNIAIV